MSLFDKAKERMDAKMVRPADQPKEDIEIVGFVRNKLEDFRQQNPRIANEGIWLTNIAYLCGFDSVYFDGISRQFRPINYPYRVLSQNRMHTNKILPTVQNRLARLVKNPPKYEVAPKSSDEEDKDAARLSKQLLLQFWDQLRINQKRLNLMMWVQQCGHAFLKVSWDTNLGQRRVLPMPDGKYQVVHEGDLRLEVVSPFEVFVDPLAKTWEDVNELIHARVRPLSYFKERYERGNMVMEEDCWLTSLQYETRINSFNNRTGAAGTNAMMKNAAIEISFYQKPSINHPFGRHVIVANGVKLKDDILPIDEIPFAKFDDVIVGGKFASESIITHLRPLQDQLNKTKSMRAAWLNRLLAGKYISARGHGLAMESFTDQSGEIIEYDPVPNAPEPHAMQVPTIPQYAYQEDEFIQADMNDTSGINEASRGQMPSASIPAIGMQLLVEQDDTRIGVVTESNEHSYADLGRILLKFAAENYKTPRLLKRIGRNNEYMVREFKGEDLRGNFDVYVRRGSTLPGSRVLNRQEIINLEERGYFGNPADPKTKEEVFRQLEFADGTDVWRRPNLVDAQISRAIDRLEKEGIKPHVSEFDKHDAWILALDDLRISDRFETMSEEQQSMILETMNEHIDWIIKLQNPTLAEGGSPEDLAFQKMQEEMGPIAEEIEPGLAAQLSSDPSAQKILQEVDLASQGPVGEGLSDQLSAQEAQLIEQGLAQA